MLCLLLGTLHSQSVHRNTKMVERWLSSLVCCSCYHSVCLSILKFGHFESIVSLTVITCGVVQLVFGVLQLTTKLCGTGTIIVVPTGRRGTGVGNTEDWETIQLKNGKRKEGEKHGGGN